MRQDAIETLQRFSGLIIALCTICLGLYWILNSFGLLMIVGYPVAFIGIALGYSAIQRLRFHRNTEGQGIVHFVEGQITYFGPESGGIVAVGDITRVMLHKIGRENVWVIEQPAQPALVIPTNAQGADRLFDAFVLLPNWNVEFTLSRLEDNQSHEDVIWQSNQYLDQTRYIH
ncbi:hypothetical protein N9X06_01685 [Paracoccaceae bacterium]|jgi:hypothetical protein|nr:hypothetical protein [Paracoccaceae bacterium]